jgi:prepilin-type N-terminal cleavage/methylation domain-containing protein
LPFTTLKGYNGAWSATGTLYGERRGQMKARPGFSLVELLVVVAIIMLLASMYMVALGRARSKAIQVAAVEAVRQKYIGELAGNVNAARPSHVDVARVREAARTAYRQTLQTGSGPTLVTELHYVVKNEAEFRAYWHTLIDPAASEPLEFRNRALVARDEDGNEYVLPRIDLNYVKGEVFPLGWEFLSTDMSEMTSGTIGAYVQYSDGHLDYIAYPGEYPVCKTVAELSHRFVQESSS